MNDSTELSKILRRVRQFINMAEGSNNNVPGSPEWIALDNEQKLARARADELLTEYAITEAMAEAAKPADMRKKGISELFEVADYSSDFLGYLYDLARHVGKFTRCIVRSYAAYDYEQNVSSGKVYGYESDVRYFQLLYTTLRLHMLGALQPEIDPSVSLDVNCYNLHNAGWNWRGIAGLYGWKKLEHNGDIREAEKQGVVKEPWVSSDGKFEEGKRMAIVYKRAARREYARRGEEMPLHIVPETYRKSAAEGYVRRIRIRLDEQEGSRAESNALAIRIDDLEQFYREENSGSYTRCPKCGKLSTYSWKCDVCGEQFGEPPAEAVYTQCPKCAKSKRGFCNEHSNHGMRWQAQKHSEAGYNAGVRQANTADLSGNKVSHVARPIN